MPSAARPASTTSTTPQNSRSWWARAPTPALMPWPTCPASVGGRVAAGRFRLAGRLGGDRFAGGRRIVVTMATTVTAAPPQPPDIRPVGPWMAGTARQAAGGRRRCSSAESGLLDLDDHRDDHGAALGARVDELAERRA